LEQDKKAWQKIHNSIRNDEIYFEYVTFYDTWPGNEVGLFYSSQTGHRLIE